MVRGRAAAAAAGGRARPGPRRGPRGGLLRLGQAARRHADPRRRGPGLLRRHRDGRAWRCRAWPRPLRALCVVPIGMEEGTETDVPSAEIGLVVGEPARFRFFSSSVRKADRPGDLLSDWTPEELSETDSLEADLPPDESVDEAYVPVRFHARLTELGVLELWCVSTTSDKRWKLEFSVREEA